MKTKVCRLRGYIICYDLPLTKDSVYQADSANNLSHLSKRQFVSLIVFQLGGGHVWVDITIVTFL